MIRLLHLPGPAKKSTPPLLLLVSTGDAMGHHQAKGATKPATYKSNKRCPFQEHLTALGWQEIKEIRERGSPIESHLIKIPLVLGLVF